MLPVLALVILFRVLSLVEVFSIAILHYGALLLTFVLFLVVFMLILVSCSVVPTGSPSRGGDVTMYVLELDINQPSLPTLYSVLVSVSVFMALSPVFYSINSPDNSLLSHSVPV